MRLFEIVIFPGGYFKADPLTIGFTQEEIDCMDGVVELPPLRSEAVAGCVRCAIHLLSEVEPMGHA